jgi:hypothetical protein
LAFQAILPEVTVPYLKALSLDEGYSIEEDILLDVYNGTAATNGSVLDLRKAINELQFWAPLLQSGGGSRNEPVSASLLSAHLRSAEALSFADCYLLEQEMVGFELCPCGG